MTSKGFVLVETEAFIEDLGRLSIGHDVVLEKLKFLEEDPGHPGLRTEGPESTNDGFKSRINDFYRVFWDYHPHERGVIILWRIGPKTWTDRLKDFSRPDLNQLKPFQEAQPDAEPERTAAAPGARRPRARQKGFFSQVDPNHLRLLGVPEAKVNAVRQIQDYDEVFELGLPGHAQQLLAELYRSGEWRGVDGLLAADLLFYRASADELENYCKGMTTRLLLDLKPEQRRYTYAQTTGPLLVKGIAGSGKTTIGLYRALYLAEQRTLFKEQPDILFITYNETLAKVVGQLFCELRGPEIQKHITVTTLRDWVKSWCKISDAQIAKQNESEGCLSKGMQQARRLLPDVQSMHKRGDRFFATEIADVIKGRGVSSIKEYQTLKRFGRKKGLRRSNERPFIWQVYETYQEELKRLGLYDYDDLAGVALEEMSNWGEGALYDAVIVDEAQDLRPIEIRLAGLLAGGRDSPRLTLLGDPQQSIYYKGVSWKDAGVDIVGRVKTLEKNFRNTRQILEAAWSLAQHGTDGARDVVAPEMTRKQGPRPTIISGSNFNEWHAVRDTILALCQTGPYNPGDIAVLAYQKEDVHQIRRVLEGSEIPVVHFRDEAFDIREYQVKAITIHSAKGLEWPVVIVAGLQQGKLPRRLPDNLDDEELASEMKQERKKLYVAMTRAMERLYLVAPEPMSDFIGEIDGELVAWEHRGN